MLVNPLVAPGTSRMPTTVTSIGAPLPRPTATLVVDPSFRSASSADESLRAISLGAAGARPSMRLLSVSDSRWSGDWKALPTLGAPPVCNAFPSALAMVAGPLYCGNTFATPSSALLSSIWVRTESGTPDELESSGEIWVSTPSATLSKIPSNALDTVAVKIIEPATKAVPNTTDRTVRTRRSLCAPRFLSETLRIAFDAITVPWERARSLRSTGSRRGSSCTRRSRRHRGCGAPARSGRRRGRPPGRHSSPHGGRG